MMKNCNIGFHDDLLLFFVVAWSEILKEDATLNDG